MSDKNLSLEDAITQRIDLTEEQIDALYEMFGKGCRQETKTRLYRRICNTKFIFNRGIYSRVMLEPYVHYVAGQSYTDEIALVRKLILEGE